MRICLLVGFFTVSAVLSGTKRVEGLEQRGGSDDNDQISEQDFYIDEDFSTIPSLDSFSEKRLQQQEDGESITESDNTFLVDDDQELTDSPLVGDEVASVSTVPAEAVPNPDELKDEADLGVIGDEGEALSPSASDSASDLQAEQNAAEPVKEYAGYEVQTQDENGVVYTTDSLNPQTDYRPPDIKEFVDSVPTFKKEKEEKEMAKKREKDFIKAANKMSLYEAERKVFLETKGKNSSRFADDIENVEAEIQAPSKPSWWQRLKLWYDANMDWLNEKFGSDQSKM